MTDTMISLLFGDVRTTPNSRYNWAVTIHAPAFADYAKWQLGRDVEGRKTVVYYKTRRAAEAFEAGIRQIVAGIRGIDAPVAEAFAAESRDWSWRP